MAVSDPIADYLTRIRNAVKAKHRKVDIPRSNLKREISRILQEEGYIRNFVEIEDGKQGWLRIYLKYDAQETPAITGLKRVSKPGRRVYVKADKVPRVMNNLGIAILSTSKGILTHKQALRERVGGEVLCYVWWAGIFDGCLVRKGAMDLRPRGFARRPAVWLISTRKTKSGR